MFLGGNWKMNLTPSESEVLAKELLDFFREPLKVKVCVFPEFTALERVSKILKSSPIYLGAQNVAYEDKGAFTGEVSPNSLIELGVEYVIIGHSERRHLFKEDNKLLNKKVSKALDKNLKVIYCVGETLEEREKGDTFKVIQTQLEEGLKDVPLSSENLIIAYEPVWAIGTGRAATPEIAQEVHAFIKKVLGNNFLVIYGGSVKPSNAKSLIAQKDIDGFLVGGASLKAKDFFDIYKAMVGE
ncbi:MAG TPA: triose-phosphate isomerase [Desulfurobacteriaceae bacterium]|nr:triose-phosphate isomerase [Desulfurobacteriaceae bacterium]